MARRFLVFVLWAWIVFGSFEIREAVDLTLTHFEPHKQIGIAPPQSALMYGNPGGGKTMLTKTVAHHSTGAKPHVTNAEAVDLSLNRFEPHNQIGIALPQGALVYGPPGGGKTMLTKAVAHHSTVTMAADRATLLEPGRLELSIEFQTRDRRRPILPPFTTSLSDEVDLEDYVVRLDRISRDDICQEEPCLHSSDVPSVMCVQILSLLLFIKKKFNLSFVMQLVCCFHLSAAHTTQTQNTNLATDAAQAPTDTPRRIAQDSEQASTHIVAPWFLYFFLTVMIFCSIFFVFNYMESAKVLNKYYKAKTALLPK